MSYDILFIGDPHIKLDNVEEFERFEISLLALISSEVKNKLKIVVVGGDLLDYHEKLFTQCLNRAINFVYEISILAKVFVLVGNHDYISNSQFLTENHWMGALKHITNVTVVDHIVEYDNMLFCPYVPPGRFIEALGTISAEGGSESIEYREVSIIFAHQEFRGCKLGIIPSEKGDEWDENYPLVVSGHIHVNHWVGNNIYYPGTPFQHTFGDVDKKVVAIISRDNFSREDNTSYRSRIREINLGLEKKHTLHYDISNEKELSNILTTLSSRCDNVATCDNDLHGKKGKNIKVKIHCNSNEKKSFLISARYKELIDQGVHIKFVPYAEEKSLAEKEVIITDVYAILKELVEEADNFYLNEDFNTYIVS